MTQNSEVSAKMENQQPTANRKSKIQAAVILLLPLTIVIIGTLMYATGWMNPLGRTNEGELLLPPLDLKELELQQGEFDDNGKWKLILLDDGKCAQHCQESIYWVRQLHTALGKNSDRVQRYFLTPNQTAPAKLSEYPGYQKLVANEESIDEFLTDRVEGAATSDNYILLADPLGNLMMYYTPEHTAKQILKDLKKLLKVSNIG
jgi:cytochrome oxidase Cu insertion factor (SCO1/SenC/PrrC family)